MLEQRVTASWRDGWLLNKNRPLELSLSDLVWCGAALFTTDTLRPTEGTDFSPRMVRINGMGRQEMRATSLEIIRIYLSAAVSNF